MRKPSIICATSLSLCYVHLLAYVDAASAWSQPPEARHESPLEDMCAVDTCLMQRVGGDPSRGNYGAWPICVNMLEHMYASLRELDIVSVGIGSDASFDCEMALRYNASVLLLDPTIRHETFISLRLKHKGCIRMRLSFLMVGIGARTQTIAFKRSMNKKIGSMSTASNTIDGHGPYIDSGYSGQVLDISTILELRRTEYFDVLKMDVEGAEFDVVAAWCQMRTAPATLLLIETHERMLVDGRHRLDQLDACLRTLGYSVVVDGVERVYWSRRLLCSKRYRPVQPR